MSDGKVAGGFPSPTIHDGIGFHPTEGGDIPFIPFL